MRRLEKQVKTIVVHFISIPIVILGYRDLVNNSCLTVVGEHMLNFQKKIRKWIGFRDW